MAFSYHRRMRGHDYRASGVYHIIYKKASEAPSFGELAGDCRIPPGEKGCAYVRRSELGDIIARVFFTLPEYHPEFRLLQYMVMPDHVHILLQVKSRLQKPLGSYLGALAGAVGKEWRNRTATAYPIFLPGFTDRIINQTRSLDAVYRYVRENPHRLAVRRMFPDYFSMVRNMVLNGVTVQAYGNLHLLANPFKEQVVVHRSNSPEENARLRELWLDTAGNDGVLVSPFISAAEKAIRVEAEALGGKIIFIRHEAFPERYKPADRDFSLCSAGRLLIISLAGDSDVISRQKCIAMNSFAHSICEGT